ncbi:hypothetical protein [Clostridium sp.]|uniref:hypothetical protein n=1 Tax=Clostridium sp. TaxID=1506 RepID=UPI0026061F4F|nr:hypothetical protein [Clostridium sp.]
MKKLLSIILTLLVLMAIGCENSVERKNMNQAKADIENKSSSKDKIQNDIDKADSLVNEKKYDEAKAIIEEVNKNDLDENQKSKVNELSSKIIAELAKINETRQEQNKKTLTQQEARQLILKEDGNFISKNTNSNVKLSTDGREYSADNIPTGDAWNVPKEPCYEFSVDYYDKNGEILNVEFEYLVGKDSENVYIMSNQGNTSVYQIQNNKKVKTFKWLKEGGSSEWR